MVPDLRENVPNKQAQMLWPIEQKLVVRVATLLYLPLSTPLRTRDCPVPLERIVNVCLHSSHFRLTGDAVCREHFEDHRGLLELPEKQIQIIFKHLKNRFERAELYDRKKRDLQTHVAVK